MKRQGFTIVECIVALLITAMIAVLIQLTFKVYEKVDQQPYDDNAQWYIFLQEMESSNNQYEIKNNGTKQSINVFSRTRQKNYSIGHNPYKSTVYMYGTEAGMGYLPLLQHVKTFQAVHSNQSPKVEFEVEFMSGEKHSGRVNFPIYEGPGE